MEAYLEDDRPTLDEVCEKQKHCDESCDAYKFCSKYGIQFQKKESEDKLLGEVEFEEN